MLTPYKPVPRDWFSEKLEGARILCLASGGGQQGPVLAAAGADVTVLDLSEEQLGRDREVAERENLEITTVRGDMENLSQFGDSSFDLIFHPISNCFIPDVIPLWKECARVLKKGGTLLAGFVNPLLYLFDDPADEENLNTEKINAIPYSDADSMSDEMKLEYFEEGWPLEFGHTLEDQIAGQIKAGFSITGFYEDRHHVETHPLKEKISVFIATWAEKM